VNATLTCPLAGIPARLSLLESAKKPPTSHSPSHVLRSRLLKQAASRLHLGLGRPLVHPSSQQQRSGTRPSSTAHPKLQVPRTAFQKPAMVMFLWSLPSCPPCAASFAASRRPPELRSKSHRRRQRCSHRMKCLYAISPQTQPGRLLSCFRPCAVASLTCGPLAVRAALATVRISPLTSEASIWGNDRAATMIGLHIAHKPATRRVRTRWPTQPVRVAVLACSL
jgi:hypothetical protein